VVQTALVCRESSDDGSLRSEGGKRKGLPSIQDLVPEFRPELYVQADLPTGPKPLLDFN